MDITVKDDWISFFLAVLSFVMQPQFVNVKTYYNVNYPMICHFVCNLYTSEVLFS